MHTDTVIKTNTYSHKTHNDKHILTNYIGIHIYTHSSWVHT